MVFPFQTNAKDLGPFYMLDQDLWGYFQRKNLMAQLFEAEASLVG